MFKTKIDEFLLNLRRKWLIFMILVNQEHCRKYGHYRSGWIIRFARHLPSPSQINAVSVLKSNSAEKLAEFLLERESA